MGWSDIVSAADLDKDYLEACYRREVNLSNLTTPEFFARSYRARVYAMRWFTAKFRVLEEDDLGNPFYKDSQPDLAFLAMRLFDNYICLKAITDQLDMAASICACYWIARKHYDANFDFRDTFCTLGVRSLSLSDVREREVDILNTLKWASRPTTPMDYLLANSSNHQGSRFSDRIFLTKCVFFLPCYFYQPSMEGFALLIETLARNIETNCITHDMQHLLCQLVKIGIEVSG